MNLLKFVCPNAASIQDALIDLSLEELRTRTAGRLHLWCGDCRGIHLVRRSSVLFISGSFLSGEAPESLRPRSIAPSSAYNFAARSETDRAQYGAETQQQRASSESAL